jgi:beta-aspartyl-peptidase (threonine type)
MTDRRWRLLIHGGAGSERIAHDNPAHEASARAGLDAALEAGGAILARGECAIDAVEAALEAGGAILARGESAIDAVETAARLLEENSCFNAGRGSVLTEHGEVELDAAIMEGRGRNAGAVAGIKTTRAPISLARRLMDHGPHVFLSGEAADRFAAAAGLEQVPNDFFILPERRRQLDEALAAGSAADPIKYGTIGAVAVDLDGNVAAATSTGGITAKRWGRIGDSPLIGAGTYADNRSAAVSATGSGEYFIRAVAAHQLAERVRFGAETLQQALDAVLADIESLGGKGGLIAVGPDGDAAWGFTTPAMYRGMADATGRTVAIYSSDKER